MNSCAFILECTKGRGWLTGAFSEQTLAACSYRGELLGLLAIHLLLLSINKVSPELLGSVHIYSDCLGAINKVENLPLTHILSKCRHSDILKCILVNCSHLSFTRSFSHVSAHQDDSARFEDLSQPAQLNCAADFGAKQALLDLDAFSLPRQQSFPLETISVFVSREKMTSDTGPHLRFHAHRQLAREEFAAAGILQPDHFDKVNWETVHYTLSMVPRMFQVWACKQVWGIAGTDYETAHWSEVSPLCPSCMQVPETCGHILQCCHAGRVKALQLTIKLLDRWMKQQGTDPDPRDCLYEYAMGRGGTTMVEICNRNQYDQCYQQMATAQNSIGWQRFMEGIICKEIGPIQQVYAGLQGSRYSARRWGTGLVTKLLERTHCQWLYRNVQVHDGISGRHATLRKEELQLEIERQQELGTDGLLDEDCHLAECNLEDLEVCSGEKETY